MPLPAPARDTELFAEPVSPAVRLVSDALAPPVVSGPRVKFPVPEAVSLLNIVPLPAAVKVAEPFTEPAAVSVVPLANDAFPAARSVPSVLLPVFGVTVELPTSDVALPAAETLASGDLVTLPAAGSVSNVLLPVSGLAVEFPTSNVALSAVEMLAPPGALVTPPAGTVAVLLPRRPRPPRPRPRPPGPPAFGFLVTGPRLVSARAKSTPGLAVGPVTITAAAVHIYTNSNTDYTPIHIDIMNIVVQIFRNNPQTLWLDGVTVRRWTYDREVVGSIPGRFAIKCLLLSTGLRGCAYTCVTWQVTLRDPI